MCSTQILTLTTDFLHIWHWQANCGRECLGSTGPRMPGGKCDAPIRSGSVAAISRLADADSSKIAFACHDAPDGGNVISVVTGEREDLVGGGSRFRVHEIGAQPPRTRQVRTDHR